MACEYKNASSKNVEIAKKHREIKARHAKACCFVGLRLADGFTAIGSSVLDRRDSVLKRHSDCDEPNSEVGCSTFTDIIPQLQRPCRALGANPMEMRLPEWQSLYESEAAIIEFVAGVPLVPDNGGNFVFVAGNQRLDIWAVKIGFSRINEVDSGGYGDFNSIG